MRINFLKRLESSVESFRLTLNKVMNQIETILKSIEEFENRGINKSFEDIEVTNYNSDEDVEDLLDDQFSIGQKSQN